MTKGPNKHVEARMGAFLREVSNWHWSEFFAAEHDDSYTSNQAIVFALIRACAKKNLQAIKLSINRLDGKLATPLKIEYPKVYYVYPNAKRVENQQPPELNPGVINPTDRSTEVDIESITSSESELPSLSIRQTVSKMSDYPRSVPEEIQQHALLIEQWANGQYPQKPLNDPLVKSVVAAHLLIMATGGSIDALSEVFDNIDGKLAETFQILGDDLLLPRYDEVAPPGALLNEEGHYQIQAETVENAWATKLGRID